MFVCEDVGEDTGVFHALYDRFESDFVCKLSILTVRACKYSLRMNPSTHPPALNHDVSLSNRDESLRCCTFWGHRPMGSE